MELKDTSCWRRRYSLLVALLILISSYWLMRASALVRRMARTLSLLIYAAGHGYEIIIKPPLDTLSSSPFAFSTIFTYTLSVLILPFLIVIIPIAIMMKANYRFPIIRIYPYSSSVHFGTDFYVSSLPSIKNSYRYPNADRSPSDQSSK
ncbi:hypothetical protein F5Y04DRAFT_142328 [Hypomontagnella monticulosa]|nr:hypothetical protein F5Y04DRAFT_142328 [Hypomontagnella monticulosa]